MNLTLLMLLEPKVSFVWFKLYFYWSCFSDEPGEMLTDTGMNVTLFIVAWQRALKETGTWISCGLSAISVSLCSDGNNRAVPGRVTGADEDGRGAGEVHQRAEGSSGWRQSHVGARPSLHGDEGRAAVRHCSGTFLLPFCRTGEPHTGWTNTRPGPSN